MPRSQLALRAVVLTAPVVALFATGPAGHWPAWWLVLPVVGLAAAAASAPDTPFAAAAGLLVLGWWSLALDETPPAWVMVAAVALLAGHLAALLASYGPSVMPLDGPTLRRWLWRGAVVLPTVPGAWALTRLLGGQPDEPSIWVLGLGAAGLATIVATAAMEVRGER